MPDTMPPCADCGHAAVHTKLAGCMFETSDPYGLTSSIVCPCAVYVPPTPTVVSSPTLERARAERDAAMEQVEAAASPEWLAEAERAIVNLAAVGIPFSTDDAWEYLDRHRVAPPREPRAMGPVVKRLLAQGRIQPDGFTQSRRRHAALIRTYTGSPS